MRQAVIDLGSNSVRLTVYEVSGKDFKPLFREKIMAGLASYVEDGVMSVEGVERACETLLTFHETLQLLNIEELHVFATASLRNIENTADAIAQIRCKTGIDVEVISGAEEAEYGFVGAMRDASVTSGLFVDVGGASTELAAFKDGAVLSAISVPLGSLKLYRDCVKGILPGNGSLQRIEKAIKRAFSLESFSDFEFETLLCVGGTSRAAAKLAKRMQREPESKELSVRELDELVSFLSRGDREASDLILRYEPERIHTIVPGLSILKYIAERFDAKNITVSRCGVREGYLCRKLQSSS